MKTFENVYREKPSKEILTLISKIRQNHYVPAHILNVFREHKKNGLEGIKALLKEDSEAIAAALVAALLKEKAKAKDKSNVVTDVTPAAAVDVTPTDTTPADSVDVTPADATNVSGVDA